MPLKVFPVLLGTASETLELEIMQKWKEAWKEEEEEEEIQQLDGTFQAAF